MSTWGEYAALARHLDHLRRTEDAAAAGMEAASDSVDRLDARLAAQHQRIVHLGRTVGQHVSSQAPPPSTVDDPGVALRLGGQRADEADEAATSVEDLAQRAPLFPSLAPVTRNTLVYLCCGLAGVIVQTGLLLYSDNGRLDQFSLLAWMCAGLPALAFFTGYLVISVWGKPRLGAGTSPRSPRLGFAICFLAMPVVYCGFKLVTSLFSGAT